MVGAIVGTLTKFSLLLKQILTASRLTISSCFNRTCFQAMCSLAFYALLRVGEMTLSNNNLEFSSVTLANNYLILNFRKFKHSGKEGATLRVIAIQNNLCCPIRLMHEYITFRGNTPGPLFVTSSGEAVPRQLFTWQLKSALDFAGFDSKRFKSHSFRIGAASHMVESGASDAKIRQAGRWASNAFLAYIRSSHS